jgi:putative zinc ribbon protein
MAHQYSDNRCSDNQYSNKTLTCTECGEKFTWTAGEQQFYAERRLKNQPKRCKPCRDRKRGS